MRRSLPRTLALPITAAVLALSATPAVGQTSTIPTTPIPEPENPDQAPISAPPNAVPTGRAVGDAGTALGILRLLPEAVETSAILPGLGEQLPEQSSVEAGMGVTSAQANSEAYLAYERSIAEASPFAAAVGGNKPKPPGSAFQTALPDNPEPVTAGFNGPSNPLLNVGLLNTRAHARWSEQLGPCVGTIADASTEVASISALNTIPTMPDLPLADIVPESTKLARGFDPAAGLDVLGGVLGGGAEASENGAGSLLSIPNTLSSRSTVRLAGMKGTERKAVESTSTLQVANMKLFAGTPLQMTIKVVSQPTLRVTSTGDAETSTVEYTAPAFEVVKDGTSLYKLDAANPTADIPMGLPLASLSEQFGPLRDVPVVGGVVSTLDQGMQRLTETTGKVLDLGVLRISIASLDERRMDMTKPFKGHQLGASARMFDLQILPTEKLKELLPKDAADRLPSSLAQVTLGEQVARAYAPEGGVDCGFTTPPAPPGGGGEQPGVPDELAYTSAAYSAVPMFWTGTAMLLIGVVLVAALPTRRLPQPARPKPSPHPRTGE